MAGIPITNLEENTALEDSSLFVEVETSPTAATKKITFANLWESIWTKITGKILSNSEWGSTISERGYLADAKDVKADITSLNTNISNLTTTVNGKTSVKIKTTYKEYAVTASVTKTITPADSGFTGYTGIYYAFPMLVAASGGFTTPKIVVGASGDSNSNVTLWSSTSQSLYVRIAYLYY